MIDRLEYVTRGLYDAIFIVLLKCRDIFSFLFLLLTFSDAADVFEELILQNE